ncbi:uncharacterized protein KY384_006716 [Bacidia gigantensis]|uniref:uncharacterized protein n=1 Tax=Bacidia gigantensis TaxID=2732470 RepID=UPI001D050B4A|nr:uncharacterized protein KY384_006716 [Bacidia gigantensis]KAG8529026.1 hypothetical protein KY384_006716 [Bacidia gigantensis]
MKDAIMQGLSEEEADHSAVEASYTISNCSFTPYSSLGVCHSIEDWTQHILKQCGTNNTRHSKCSSSVLEIQQHPAFRLENSNVSASGMTILMSAFQYNTSLLELSQETQTSHYPDHRAHAYTDVFEFPANDVLGEFYVFYPSSEPRNQGNVFQYAFKGTLSLCVYTFNTTIVNGQTKTKVLDITRNLPWQVESQVVESEGNVRHDVYATYSDEFQRMKVGMDGKSRQSITNYLAREVFYGSWDGGLQTDSTMSTHKDHPRASSDAFRAIDRACICPLVGGDYVEPAPRHSRLEKQQPATDVDARADNQ